ncbi:metallophosphoesterase [Ectothiorhodospiraceae bacterium WFHF3C12]|nr:metallophosphoesterase [Ectothiorhodospiraceae bacterium WFHF3C12]
MSSMQPEGYDLIGDIHGHAEPLRGLLRRLGYRYRDGRFAHPTRQAIFLGDFIDRGPEQRGVLEVVRPMVMDGAALAVMGNHELNALAFHTPDPAAHGEHLRRRSAKNIDQHRAFLDEHEHPEVLDAALEWFWDLPLWLDLGELRVVHAAWDTPALNRITDRVAPGNRLTQPLLEAASRPGTAEQNAVENLLKGIEAELPAGHGFSDKDGHHRRYIRLKWWRYPQGETWRSMFLGPPGVAAKLPEAPLPPDVETGYPDTAPPVFVGHYWMVGEPTPQAANVACLDYSVARDGGRLVAYRWDGEQVLRDDKFDWVERR